MKPTIENLRNGLCAVRNDGTVEELRKVLKLAFPDDNTTAGGKYKYYFKNRPFYGRWSMNNQTILPSFSVKEFLQPEFPRVMLVSVCGKNWFQRVVHSKIGNYWYAMNDTCFLNQITDDFKLSCYRYVKEIEEESTLELTLDQIAEKFGVSVDNLKIKK
jgi:hypothetical protein